MAIYSWHLPKQTWQKIAQGDQDALAQALNLKKEDLNEAFKNSIDTTDEKKFTEKLKSLL